MQTAEEIFDAYLRDYGAADTLFVMDEPAQMKETLDAASGTDVATFDAKTGALHLPPSSIVVLR